LYIPGYGNVLTADFSKPSNVGVRDSAFKLPNPYADASAGPMSAQQRQAVTGGLGPLLAPPRTTPPTPRPATPLPTPEDTVVRQNRPYPTTLPPLSPQMLEALEQRRALSLRRLQEAEATADSLRQRAELENVGRMLGIEETTASERRSGLADLAARGVARSPMFANPFRRELARQQQQQIGESQQQLTRTLDQLGEVLRGARSTREEELSQLAFDETRERSNIARLLGLE